MLAIAKRLEPVERLHRPGLTDIRVALQISFIRAREAARKTARELLYPGLKEH